MAQIAAETLGLHYEDIHVVTGDTDSFMYDTGQHASGGCYQIGHAVMGAAEEARKQLLERAAKKLVVAPDDLEIREKCIYVKSDPRKVISVGQVAKEAIGSSLFLTRKPESPIFPPIGSDSLHLYLTSLSKI
jgi:xanthine dehydrogenase molybdenum-binding subunit